MTSLDPELAIVAGRVDLLMERARAARSIAERRFALDALARGLLLADPGAVGETLREEARSLRVDASTIAASEAPRLPHAVAVPLVARERGLAFVRQLYVTFDPVGLAGDDGLLDPDARRAVTDAITAAAGIAPPPSEPALHRLVAAQPGALRHARVEGRSLSAAAFVSAASLWTERPARADVAVTGELRGDRVVGVGEIEAKVRAARAFGMRALVVPAGDLARARSTGASIELIGVEDAASLLDAALDPTSAPRLEPEQAADEARALSRTGWRGYRWPSVRERIARISGTLPGYRVDLRVELLALLAGAQRHLGDPAGSLELLREAETLLSSEEGRRAVPDAPITYLYLQRAMTCRQLSRFGEAARAASRAVRVAKSARLRGAQIKALGVLGLVALARGQVERAVAAFDESLEITFSHEPHRTARTRAYLVEAYGAAGREDDARAQYEAAMEELERGPEGSARRASESWVRTSWGSALFELGRFEAAIDALDVPAVRVSLAEAPLPGLLARRHLGLALVHATERARGFELLAASPLAHGRALEPHLAFMAHLNVLFEARARLATGAWGSDIAGRARRALDHVPRHDRVGAYLGRSLEATRALLDAPGRPRAARALDTLISRCVRLG